MLLRYTTILLLAAATVVFVSGTAIAESSTATSSARQMSSDVSADSPARLAPLPKELRQRLEAGGDVVWSAHAGESLQVVLGRWTRDAGWTLIWAAGPDRDIVLDADLMFPAGTTLRDALRTTFRSLSRGPAASKACEYENRTLRIVAPGARCD